MLADKNHFIKTNLILLASVVFTLILYYRFLFFEHISWDDPEMVFKNHAVQKFDLKLIFTGHFVGNYIPITMLMHSIAWFLFENHSGGHHAINILFHVMNGILVYRLGKELFKDEVVINLGTIIFLLHPLQIESVGWISELKNILSTTFYLASVLYYLQFKKAGKTYNYIFAFVLFILGCLSKSSVVVLPLVLICLDLLLDNKFNSKYLLNKIPFLIVSVIVGLINIKTQTADQFINYGHEFPYYQRVAFAGFAILKYVILFVLPIKLSVMYPYPEHKVANYILGFIVVLIISGILIYLIRQKRFSLLSIILFFLVNLMLVLQFLPFGEVLYADRYMYVPIIALGWAMGIIISTLKISSQIAGVLFILLFSVISFGRTSVWRSSIVLFEDILKKFPNHFVALNSAGVESMFLNEDAKALSYFDRAAQAAPRNYKSFYNRGLLHLKNRRPQEAIRSFNQTLDLYQYGKAYTGRASAYYLLNDIPKAMTDARKALEEDPKSARAYFVLGNCFNELNQIADAISHYDSAIALNNTEPDYYFKRAIANGKKQNFKACLSDLELCLRLDPAYYEAYYWRGVSKVNLNQDPCPDLQIAARHNFEPAIIAYNKYCR